MDIVPLDKEAALRELLYTVDSMCEEFRNSNYGSAKEWSRHIDKAYEDYQEFEEE